MKTPRRQVIKDVKPSGNACSVYVPKEWIGQMVEISIFSVEAAVLEALYPYLANIQGIYLFGPHAKGAGGPDESIDVLVVADDEKAIPETEGMNLRVLSSAGLEEYAKEHAA